jgi:cobalt-zinc-cadmium efflux system outer membrane protein
VRAATGANALYQPGEEERARAQVTDLLGGGLTSQEAVQVALLNNRGLQELLFEIGVGRADAVQAGLLSNPSLQAVIRFPVDGGSTGAEGGILQNLIELWHLPVRKQVAEGQVERTVLDVAQHAVVVAAQAKAAYFTALASSSTLSVAEENLKTAQDFLDLTLERQEAGAATQVDVNAARSTFLEQQVLIRSARFAALDAKRRLSLALGLTTPPEEITLADALVEPPDRPLDLRRLLNVAHEHRLDLRSAGKNVEVTGSVIPLERRRMWRSVKVGVGFESEGSDLALGPAINLELPIFDQNQAQIAKAEYRYAQALRRLEGVSAHVAQQVRGAYERYDMAQDTARLYRTELLPLREASLDLARESFAAGKTGFLSVLEAQDRLLATRREYVDRLEAVALSIPDLEAACGRPLDVLLRSDE